MPSFNWALLISGGMLMSTSPIFSGALLMILADLDSSTLLFDPIFGGGQILFEHVFGFFGHPEAYILRIGLSQRAGLPEISRLPTTQDRTQTPGRAISTS